MARKTMVELRAEMEALWPDNATGLISPADIRQVTGDFIDTMTPAYGVLELPGPSVVALTTTPTMLVFSLVQVAQAPEWTANAGAGTLRCEVVPHTATFNLNIDCYGSSARIVTAAIHKNGVSTGFSASAQLTGTTDPVSLSLIGIDYDPAASDYQIYMSADANASVTFRNGAFIGQLLPVRTT